MKSHFRLSNHQRNGMFLLLIIIFLLQATYLFLAWSTPKKHNSNPLLKDYRNEIDSLRQVAMERDTVKVFPFNPNYITDFKGYTLGMSSDEIDRLHAFRKKNNWINSVDQFQKVTQVSDSLLAQISPYFKFPEWVTSAKPKSVYKRDNRTNQLKTFEQKQDLNKASATDLQRVYGVGEKLSARILAYRNKFKDGFASDVELQEIYGLSTEVIERIKHDFVVKTPRPITTINLNTATRDELVTIKYIDYEIAKNIIEERTLRDGFKDLEELTKVKDFPVHKKALIQLYLYL